ncbi:MAG: PKD domain-containing protein [Bacteroidetes bacterium]|nr:PKD domain-containing protein [Bacteroidota bacterium]
MRTFIYIILILITYSLRAQINKISVLSDSLSGFNELQARSDAYANKCYGAEYKFYINRAQRNYINSKYNLSTGSNNTFKTLAPGSYQTMAACTNMDFTAGMSGWTETNGLNSNSTTMAGCCGSAGGNSSIVSGGTDSNTGISLASPFGGPNVCMVNNMTTGQYTDRISQTFAVTPSNSLLRIAFLAVLQSAGHGCSDQPYMNISIINCSGVQLPCPSFNIVAGSGCGGIAAFTDNGSVSYTPSWQISALDLTPYLGSCITIQVTAGACTMGGHWGYGYFVAQCQPMTITLNNVQYPVGTSATTITTCGAMNNTVTAPPGLNPYTWNGPPGSGVTNVTNQTFTTSTSGTYYLTMNPLGSCSPITRTVVLQNSMPPIASFNFSSTACSPTLNVNSTSSLNGGSAISSTNWTWGDGNTGSGNPANYTYTTAGTYPVKLVVTNLTGCRDSITQNVTISLKPTANFIVPSLCYGNSFNFNNSSTTPSGTMSYTWNFGNSSSPSNATSPSYTYPSAGNYTASLIVQNSGGCIDSISKPLSVYALPIAAFNIGATGCSGPTVAVVSTSSLNGGSSITNYTYNWGDATANATTANANHTYASSGPKTISLTIVNANGCKDSTSKNVTISQKPTANFSVNNICLNGTTSFTNNSTTPSGTMTYTWDYGNASALSNIAAPAYVYPASGTFTASLVVMNTDGCSDTMKKTVQVYGRAIPNFTPSAVCYNTASNFINLCNITSNLNTGSISTYNWDFGISGGTSALPNPVFTYNSATNATVNTTYTATLWVTTINGCKDSISKPVTVYALPTAKFTSDSVCFGNPSTMSFSGNSNGNPLGFFRWDFGNTGNSITNTSLSTQTVFASYGNTPVSYTVYTTIPSTTLVCSASTLQNVWVNPNPISAFTFSNLCVDKQPINFSGSGSNIPIGSITNYAWTYGNGNTLLTSPIATSTQSYSLPGSYLVTLTVTSNANCTSISSNTVYVWDLPYANISYLKNCFGKAMSINANNLPGGTIATYQWNFNNTPGNVQANGQNVTYTFATAGTQTLSLYLTSDKGCTNTIVANSYVNYKPIPRFYAPKRAGCTDLCISIQDSSSSVTGPASVNSWQWNFGNGQSLTTSASGSFQNCYTNKSNFNLAYYSLSLICTTDSGCVDSISKKNYITVYPRPVASFDWAGSDGTIMTPYISFTNTSQGNNFSAWFFNDNNITDSTTANPVHYYDTQTPRSYNVFLAVRNQWGCKDTVSRPVYIGPDFIFYIPNCFTPNGDGVNDYFTGKGVGIKNFNLWIFDRWGEKIFYSNDIEKGWDGTVKGNVIDTKSDVYQWKVIVTDLWQKDHEYVGHVTLLK